MTEKRSITVRIRGREFRVRGGEEEESLQRVAVLLNDTLSRVEQRTGVIDSLDVALLTALNLARELVDLREGRARIPDSGRLRRLIELAESAAPSA